MSWSLRAVAPAGPPPIQHQTSVRRDACFAKPAVGIYARVDEVDPVPNELARSCARESVDTAAIDLAEGLPAALAVLVY